MFDYGFVRRRPTKNQRTFYQHKQNAWDFQLCFSATRWNRASKSCFYSVRSARIGSIIVTRRLLGVYAAR